VTAFDLLGFGVASIRCEKPSISKLLLLFIFEIFIFQSSNWKRSLNP